jgi:hypothetical protein
VVEDEHLHVGRVGGDEREVDALLREHVGERRTFGDALGRELLAYPL